MPKKKSRRPAARARRGQTGGPPAAQATLGEPGSEVVGLLNQAGQLRPAVVASRAERVAPTPSVEADPVDSGALSVTATPWAELLQDRQPQALGLTYRFAAESEGEPYPVTVRLRGHRLGVVGSAGPKDVLNVVHEVPRVVPGSGDVAVTTRVLDVHAGTWQVQAEGQAQGRGQTGLPRSRATGQTGYAPVVRVMAPGVRLGAWPAFVACGVVLGMTAQTILASRSGLSVGRTTLVTVLACLVGVVGGKVYFLALHRDRQAAGLWMVGMAIQGFVLGMVATALAGAAVAGLALGTFLDVTGAGLLLGMSVGRLGCFFGGCCAGRPTASRWGLWSSDRQYGMRRVPTQLLEAAAALLLGVGATAILLAAAPTPHGAVFVAGLSGYTLARQLLFPLRDLPRKTRYGRPLVLTFTAAGLAASIAAISIY